MEDTYIHCYVLTYNNGESSFSYVRLEILAIKICIFKLHLFLLSSCQFQT